MRATSEREKLERAFTKPATMGEGEKNILGTKLEARERVAVPGRWLASPQSATPQHICTRCQTHVPPYYVPPGVLAGTEDGIFPRRLLLHGADGLRETRRVLPGALPARRAAREKQTQPRHLCPHNSPFSSSQVTAEFLEFSRSRGNDLITPAPQYDFPGLKPGDRWCLCASRWTEALKAGVAPPVFLEGTAEAALKYASMEDLLEHAIDRTK